ncbi:hypothetical protein BDN70DRAFT_269569 [Pholiota conissans]|uniref:Uncharacterized protein n=1 Tax=Pholiota conissans TaxID=109636 RepID=A0A9P5YU65_9AGAR|nr:hypothetical protein BDN70DRAFT_269569 [Pholiota conissans]
MAGLPPSFARVVVDDSDSSIQYGSSWSSQSSGSRDQLNSGPVFGGTLHQTTTSTTFSTKFSGSDIVVYSSVDPVIVNGVLQADPEWECIIDGNSLGLDKIDSAITTPQNNIDICHSPLTPGDHELVVKVTSKGSPFWLDNIQYTPLPGADLSNTVQKVYKTDPDIEISSDFTTAAYGIAVSQTPGATVTYKFTGTSVSWVGYIFGNYAKQSATATYSIDGGAPVTFALPTSQIFFGNTVFFKTPNLSQGSHTLVVTYKGDGNSMPLALDYFFLTNGAGASSGGGGNSGGGTGSSGSPVQNGGGNTVTVGGTVTVVSTTSSTTGSTSSTTGTSTGTSMGSTTPTGTSSSTSDTQSVGSALESGASTVTQGTSANLAKKSNTGAIVGGVVGGLALVALAVIVFLVIRRRRRNGRSGIIYEKPGHYRDFEQDGSG